MESSAPPSPEGLARRATHVSGEIAPRQGLGALQSRRSRSIEIPEQVLGAWATGGHALQHLRQVDETLSQLGASISDVLDGRTYGALMSHLMTDVNWVANMSGLSHASTAEALRHAVNDGRAADDLYVPMRNVLQFALYGVREKSLAEAELAATMHNHPVFQGFPVEHAWRFGMEQERWNDPGAEHGLRFENEPGYMGAFLRGLKRVIDSESSSSSQGKGKIDAKWVESLHHTAVNGVFPREFLAGWHHRADNPVDGVACLTAPGSNVEEKAAHAASVFGIMPDQLEPLKQGYRDGRLVEFTLTHPKNLSEEGLSELAAFQSHFPNWAEFRSRRNERLAHVDWEQSQHGVRWACPAKSRSEVVKFVDKVLRAHDRKIKAAENEDDLLRTIANTCSTLERAHVFHDGNARMFGGLLLNKLLLSAGLSPSMMPDANKLDGYCAEELVAHIREGQHMFQQFV